MKIRHCCSKAAENCRNDFTHLRYLGIQNKYLVRYIAGSPSSKLIESQKA